MSKADSTALKLGTTPTGGADAAHSPYYRRLLSAGYKGYLQGTLSGASMYGVIGLAIGALAAAPFMGIIGFAGFASLALAAGGLGVVKGATTFGNIGSIAAINAESADLSEQRRYLLDRYHDLPEGPEGDREAAEITRELTRRQDNNEAPPPLFHWKTVAICAAIGAALALTVFCTPVGGILFAGTHIAEALTLAHIGTTGAVAASIGTAIGGMMGAVVGLDRYYVRKWFDVTERVVHSSPRTDIDPALRERIELVSRLNEATKEDDIVKESMAHHAVPDAPATMTSVITNTKPDTKISQPVMQDRVSQLQHAMQSAL